MGRRGKCFRLPFYVYLLSVLLTNPLKSLCSEDEESGHRRSENPAIDREENPQDNRDIINRAIDNLQDTLKELKENAQLIKEMENEIKSAKSAEDKNRLEGKMRKTTENYDKSVEKAKKELDSVNSLSTERNSVDPSKLTKLDNLKNELKPHIEQLEKKTVLTAKLKDLNQQLDKARLNGDAATLKGIKDEISKTREDISKVLGSPEKIGASLSNAYKNASENLQNMENQVSKLISSPQPIQKVGPVFSDSQPAVASPQSGENSNTRFANPGKPTTSNEDTQQTLEPILPPSSTAHTFPKNSNNSSPNIEASTNSNPDSNIPQIPTTTATDSAFLTRPSQPESGPPSTITNATNSPPASPTANSNFSDAVRSESNSKPPNVETATFSNSKETPTLSKTNIPQVADVTQPAPSPAVSPSPTAIDNTIQTNLTPDSTSAYKGAVSPQVPKNENPTIEAETVAVDQSPAAVSGPKDPSRQLTTPTNPMGIEIGPSTQSEEPDKLNQILSTMQDNRPKKPTDISEFLKRKLGSKDFGTPRGLASTQKDPPPKANPLTSPPQTLFGMLFAWLGLR